MMVRRFFVATLVAWCVAVPAADSGTLTQAKALFERYVALEKAYDPTVADLYADTALIRNKRTYPNGQVRELTIPAPQYKALVRAAMPIAASRGDRSSYSDIRYVVEGNAVRVVAMRYSELKKYSSPISLLCGRTADGSWRVLEELSESQP